MGSSLLIGFAGNGIKFEEERDWFSQSLGYSLELLKRWSVPAPFDEAQEIHRHTRKFSELFLSFVQLLAYLPNAPAE